MMPEKKVIHQSGLAKKYYSKHYNINTKKHKKSCKTEEESMLAVEDQKMY